MLVPTTITEPPMASVLPQFREGALRICTFKRHCAGWKSWGYCYCYRGFMAVTVMVVLLRHCYVFKGVSFWPLWGYNIY